MTDISKAGTFKLGDRTVKRIGYGAMQLAGPGVFGPPKDRDTALAVLREAVASGVDHIDTSDFYGPHVTNEIIREALHPYPETSSSPRSAQGAARTVRGIPAFSAEDLTSAVHDNLRNLGVEALDVVNLRAMFAVHGPAEGSIAAPLNVLASCSSRASCATSASATSRPNKSQKAARSRRSSACRTSTMSRIATTTR